MHDYMRNMIIKIYPEKKQENIFGSTFPQTYYLKWNDFLNKVSSSSKLNSKFETSLATTKIISDIFEKGGKR